MQVALEAARDATIYEEGQLSNGAGSFLFAGATAPRNDGAVRRALLAFDVAGAIPAGATITGVALTLTVTMSIAGPQPVTLHRLLADWGEGSADAPNAEGAGTAAVLGDVTWTDRIFDGQPWTTPGGDFAAAPSAEAAVLDSGTATWDTTAALVADVQQWLDEPATNFGWLAIGNEATATTAKRFASRQAPQIGNRPRLVVDYEIAAPACTGDCDASGTVAINELILGVNIALGSAPVTACPSFDSNGNGVVAINELITAVNNALGAECGA